MRQIKFRGKRVDNGKWVYGNLVNCSDCIYIVYEAFADDYRWGFENVFIPIDHATVGQFTGLLDKNGNEIWEGDVYRIEFSKIEELYSVDINVIKYSIADGYSGFTIEFSDFAEVIGNIHDNPSLLTNK
jgi:uncharacterized phage protein (TIGR01671 family)